MNGEHDRVAFVIGSLITVLAVIVLGAVSLLERWTRALR